MLNRYFTFIQKSHKVVRFLFAGVILVLTLSMLSAEPISSEAATPSTALSYHASAALPIWSGLPKKGFDMRVRALETVGSNIYVGGDFTQTADGTLTDLGGIARYDTTANTWHSLPNQGLNNEVIELALVGNDLYLAGNFTQTEDGSLLDLGNIARFDTTAGTWNALPKKGLNAEIHALAVIGSDLFVGGKFTQTGDGTLTDLGGIARYDTLAGTWNALPNKGLNGQVFAMATSGSDLYVGGNFTKTGNEKMINLNGLARFDTVASAWHTLPNQGLNGVVTALTVFGSDLYAGGIFDQTYDGALHSLGNIAHLNMLISTWDALPNQGLNNQVFTLAVVDNDLYVGGIFEQTGDGSIEDLNHIARLDAAADAWYPLPHQGLSDWVFALGPFENYLYVGGNFIQTWDGVKTNLMRVARLGFYDNALYLPLVKNQ